MGAAESATLIRSLYDAFSRGDVDAVAGGLAEDIAWHAPGDNLGAGEFRSRQEVLEFMGRLGELTAGSLAVTIHDLLASDDHVVVLQTETGTRGEVTATLDYVAVWHVRADLVQEVWFVPVDAAAADAFWAADPE